MTVTSHEILEAPRLSLINPGYESGRAQLRTTYAMTRTYKVTGLTGSDSYAKQYAACTATSPDRVPQPGEPHLSNPNLWVVDVSAEFQGNDTAIVTVNYEQNDVDFPQLEFEIGSHCIASYTKYSTSGERIYTLYNGKKYWGYAPILVYYPTIAITQSGRSWQSAAEDVTEYMDTVSDGGGLPGYGLDWVKDDDDGKGHWVRTQDKSRTWLCRDVQSYPTGNGNTYAVRYDFAFDPKRWFSEAHFPGLDGKEDQEPESRDYNERREVKRVAAFPLQFV